MDPVPWAVPDRWTAYLHTAPDKHPSDVDPDAVLGLATTLHHTYSGRGHGRALAVTGEEPGLSATVAAAVRAHWQTPVRRRLQWYPAWWAVPAGLELDRVVRALAEHLGSPVARGQNPGSWVIHLLNNQQRVPVLVLSDLGNLPVARSEHNSLPRLLAYLVKYTSTVFVLVDPDVEQVLFDAPAGIEMATRTTLITLPHPGVYEKGGRLPIAHSDFATTFPHTDTRETDSPTAIVDHVGCAAAIPGICLAVNVVSRPDELRVLSGLRSTPTWATITECPWSPITSIRHGASPWRAYWGRG